jgi:hypothetical protein
MDLPGSDQKGKQRWMYLLPATGTAIFVLLYLIAAFQYPGGSPVNPQAAGFSWKYNYWCHLLNENGLNGMYNEGRITALTAMAVLAISLSTLWYLFPLLTTFTHTVKRGLQVTGFLSMGVLLCLPFSSHHDAIINAAGFFGLIALGGCLAGLYGKRQYFLLAWGLLNLLLVGVNNYLYYMGYTLYVLPPVQKISFLSILAWIFCLSRWMYQSAPPKKL